jgi:hypothetical protein
LPSRLLPLFAMFAVGCSVDSPSVEPGSSPPQAIGTAFDAANCGRITGCVTWHGAIPNPTGFLFCVPQPDGRGLEYHDIDNPNRPHIDAKTRAIAGAVVFLRDIDPAKSHAWDLPPVHVEMGSGQITVVQGARRGRVGFVRRGESIVAASTEAVYHVLRARGDEFFSVTLPDPHSPATRTLSAAGRVELSSATGLYWARADLFVADHPYFTVTDAEGRYQLENVPGGPVQVVVWLPGWDSAEQERDPDSTAITRMTYSPPLERSKAIAVKPKSTEEANVSVP